MQRRFNRLPLVIWILKVERLGKGLENVGSGEIES